MRKEEIQHACKFLNYVMDDVLILFSFLSDGNVRGNFYIVHIPLATNNYVRKFDARFYKYSIRNKWIQSNLAQYQQALIAFSLIIRYANQRTRRKKPQFVTALSKWFFFSALAEHCSSCFLFPRISKWLLSIQLVVFPFQTLLQEF